MANAPVKDIENQISALQKVADELNNSTATGTGEYIYSGKKYSKKELDSFLSTVKKDISLLKKSIKPVLDLQSANDKTTESVNTDELRKCLEQVAGCCCRTWLHQRTCASAQTNHKRGERHNSPSV